MAKLWDLDQNPHGADGVFYDDTDGNRVSVAEALDAVAAAEAFAALTTTGVVVKTGSSSADTRTITGTSDRITLSDGDGVSGNPTIDIASTYAGQSSITTVGTIGTGTWQATAVAVAFGGTGATTASGARSNIGANDANNLDTGTIPDGRFPSWVGYTAATKAALEAADVPAAVNHVHLLSYANDDDGGHSLWRRKSAGESNAPGQITSNDGARWEYAEEEIRVEAFGAVGDGSTDDQPAFQTAVDFGVFRDRGFTILAGGKTYQIDDEVDISAATERFALRGTGQDQTTFSVSAFGAAKKLFKAPANIPLEFTDFTISGGSVNKSHPIGIHMPGGGRTKVRRVGGSQLGNTTLWCARPYNCDWGDLDLFFSGYQPIHRSISGPTLDITSGSANITASSSVFTSDDVGKEIVVQLGSDNTGWVAKIDSQTGSAAVLDRNAPITATGRKFSFTTITGDISASSTTLTLSQSELSAADVGRMVYVEGADANGGILTTTIASRTSDTVCELADAANTTVSGATVYFAPTIYLGGHGFPGDTPVNDITINTCLIEGFRGAGIIIDGGLHLYLNNFKTHGLTWSEFSNFGYTGESMVLSSVNRVVIKGWEHEFCTPRIDNGPIRLVGTSPGVQIDGLTINAPCVGSYFITFNPSDTNLAYLHLGPISARHDWSQFQGLITASSSAARRRVFGYGAVAGGSTAGTQAPVQTTQVSGSIRAVQPLFLSNDQQFGFVPATPAGVLVITSEESGSWVGLFHFRISAPSGASDGSSLIVGGSSTSNTIGTASSLNVAVSSGELVIENKTGTGRRFYLSVLG